MDGADGRSGWSGWMYGWMDGNDWREYEGTLNVRCPMPLLITFLSLATELAGIVSSTINMTFSVTGFIMIARHNRPHITDLVIILAYLNSLSCA